MQNKTYFINAQKSEIKTLKTGLKQLFYSWGISPEDSLDIIVSIDEALTNILIHGYKGITSPSQKVELNIALNIKQLQVTIKDSGQKYDLDNVPKPSIEDNLKGVRTGGFGVFLMKSLMDKIQLSRKNNKNTLQMSKNLTGIKKALKLQVQT